MFVFQTSVMQKKPEIQVQPFKQGKGEIGTFSPQSKIGKAFSAFVDLNLAKINPVV